MDEEPVPMETSVDAPTADSSLRSERHGPVIPNEMSNLLLRFDCGQGQPVQEPT
jgi:hypothetical protein